MKRVLIGGFAVLVLALAFGPFLVPVPALEGTVSARALMDADGRVIAIDGLQVHYKQIGDVGSRGAATGSRFTYLLLHGFGASTFSWREVLAEFGADGGTVAYDRTGFGLSERPLEWTGTHPYGSDAQVQQTLHLLDALRVQRAVLVGNSAGGRAAVDFALAHPERVAALILVSPAVGAGGPPRWLTPLLRTPQMQHLGPLLARRISSGDGRALLRQAWHDPGKLTPAIVAGYRLPLRVANWDRALWLFASAPRSEDPLPRLHELAAIPTLVISGDDDRVVPVATSKAVAAAMPDSTLVLLPACGHVPQEECPAAFMHAVRDFMQRVPAADAAAATPEATRTAT